MPQVFAYESDPYRREISVRLLSAGAGDEGCYAVVDDTVLYPGGGGQPRDHGTLAGVEISAITLEGAGARLALEGPVTGETARMVVDWRLRYDRMQQHTAQHVLTAVAADEFGWDTTSFHLGNEVCDIELDTSSISRDDLSRLQGAVADRVRAALPVRARRVPMDEYRQMTVRSRGLPDGLRGEVRLVEIEGLDLTTCGGTHVARTSEVETVCLLDTESARGGSCTRLRWLAGRRVRERLLRHEARSRDLRQALGVADEELAQATLSLGERLKAAGRRIRHLEAVLAGEVAARLIRETDQLVHADFEDVEPSFVQAVARTFAASDVRKVALLTSRGPKGPFFMVAGGGAFEGDVQALGACVAKSLDAPGGGSGSFFQGKPASLDRLPEALLAAAKLAAEP
jgi:Ser-tRNA(Ala) deacylase AlaX